MKTSDQNLKVAIELILLFFNLSVLKINILFSSMK